MRIPSSSMNVLRYLREFRYATQKDIRQVVFSYAKSDTTCNRVLERLLSQRLIARVSGWGERGPFVYMLGQASDPGVHLPRHVTAQMYHTLQITSTFSDIVTSGLNVHAYATEPDTHERINYQSINPDLYLKVRSATHERQFWIEVDMDTEGKTKLRDKLRRYHEAWSGASSQWDPWPIVLWVVRDNKRRDEIRALIAETPKESQPMHELALFDKVVQAVSA